jgi:hypothetical protein
MKDASAVSGPLWRSLAGVSERLDESHRLPPVRAGSNGIYLLE